MHRTQILLEDEQYARLKVESARTGRSIGDLVRSAVDSQYGDKYGADYRERLRRALRDSAGSAGPDDFDGLSGEEYVEKVRGAWGERSRTLWT